jgi:hypothetical protein
LLRLGDSSNSSNRRLVICSSAIRRQGFELLGNKDSLQQQLGGIYALEGVMKNAEQYYGPVLDALCALVRDSTKTETSKGPPATDIQAALTVIGRRTVIGEEKPNLTNAHIPSADLGDAKLSGALRNGRISRISGQTTNSGGLASGTWRVLQRGNPSRFSLAGRSALPIQRHQQGGGLPCLRPQAYHPDRLPRLDGVTP